MGRAGSGVLASALLANAVGFSVLAEEKAWVSPYNDFISLPPGELTLRSDAYATTDKGNRIDLMIRSVDTEEFDEFILRSRSAIEQVASKAMCRRDAYKESNCHGWTFTRGEYILRNEQVQTILDDNGYVRKETPQQNDVVVYRDNSGNIIHTGIVCGFVGDHQPLVQSKWGAGALYIHFLDEHPYTSNYEFYSTERQSIDRITASSAEAAQELHALVITSSDASVAVSAKLTNARTVN